MGSPKPRVYTLPACGRCDVLKGWLVGRGVEYEERPFAGDAQVDLIMRNVFGSPPVLEVGPRAVPAEELFVDDVLVEDRVREVLASEEG